MAEDSMSGGVHRVGFHRPPRRLQCKWVSCCVIRPVVGGLFIGPGKACPGPRKGGILVQSLLKESDGLVYSLLGGRQHPVPAEKIRLISTEVLWPPLRSLVLGLHNDARSGAQPI